MRYNIQTYYFRKVRDSEDWELTIGSVNGPAYKGILLQAQQSGNYP